MEECSKGSYPFDDVNKYSVTSLMGYLKGRLSLELFQRYERIGKRYLGTASMGARVCASTVGLTEALVDLALFLREKV